MNSTAWRGPRHGPAFVPDARIELSEIASVVASAAAPGTTLLRFRFAPGGPGQLEAVREARRALIREQWTRGLEEGEPALSEALFTATGVLWEVPADERARCREILAALIRRANRPANPAASDEVPGAGRIAARRRVDRMRDSLCRV